MNKTLSDGKKKIYDMEKGELWLAKLPQWTGREQLGTRPALIMTDTEISLIIVILLTSNLKTLKFQNIIKIEPSKKNGLDKESVALIFHIKSIDKRSLIHKIGMLEDSYVTKINQILKNLLRL